MENKPNNLEKLRHSCAHLLAAAVMELWPKTKRTIGPSIESGFYFDFDFGNVKISEVDFPKIEKKMHELVKSWKSFDKHELAENEAIKEYPENVFKYELIKEFSEAEKRSWVFTNPAITGSMSWRPYRRAQQKPKILQTLSVAGAYWHGDEKNKMLTRIYGTAFPTQKELDDYVNNLAEIKKRDHRRIAKDLDLYTISDLVGSGLPLWTPKGP